MSLAAAHLPFSPPFRDVMLKGTGTRAAVSGMANQKVFMDHIPRGFSDLPGCHSPERAGTRRRWNQVLFMCSDYVSEDTKASERQQRFSNLILIHFTSIAVLFVSPLLQ